MLKIKRRRALKLSACDIKKIIALMFVGVFFITSTTKIFSQNSSGQTGQPNQTGQTNQSGQPGQSNRNGTGEPSGVTQGTTGLGGQGIGDNPSRQNPTGAARIVSAPAMLDLAQTIELALQNNLSTLLAAERETEARGFQREALANLLPNISASAFQASTTANLRANGINIPFAPTFVGPYGTFDSRVRFAQNIFSLAAIRAYQASKSGVEAARLQEGLARQQVATFAALAYLQVLQARESVSVAQANLDLAQSLLKLAQDQRNAGVATGLDVTRAQVRVAQEQVRVAQAQTQTAQTELQLQRIIGVPQGSPLNLIDALRFAPENFPSIETALATANANRFEIRINEQQVRRLDLERRAIVAEYYPNFGIAADYGTSGVTPTNTDLPTRRVQIQLNVPIFNGGLTRARVAVAASQRRQAELQLSDVRGQVENDVRLALQTLTTTAAQVRAAQESLTLARRELQLARDRFAAGVADNIEIINAQNSLANAQDAVVGALAVYNLARLNLASALGSAENFRF